MKNEKKKNRTLLGKLLKIIKKQYEKPIYFTFEGEKHLVHKGDESEYCKPFIEGGAMMLQLINKIDSKKPKKGDIVLVRDEDDDDWMRRTFFAEVDGQFWCNSEYYCFDDFHSSKEITAWKQMKKIK